MSYKIEKNELSGELTQLFFSGDLILNDSNTIKDELLAYSIADVNFVLSFDGVTNIDLSVLQILEAFRKSMDEKGQKVEFIWNLNEDLKKLIELSGFLS